MTGRGCELPGSFLLITGCMFSGKTTEMLRRLEHAHGAILFKHQVDRRYRRDAVVSHGGLSRRAVEVAGVDDMDRRINRGVEMLAVDEAHFFDDSLLRRVRAWRQAGRHIIMTGLDRDSWGVPFPLMQGLAVLATVRLVLTARCARCDGPADRTHRRTPIVDGQMVGGSESYEPRCMGCWHAPREARPVA